MKLAWIIRVVSVDMWGYCGRDHHPTLEHNGHQGVVTGMTYIPFEEYEPDVVTSYFSFQGEQVFHVILDTGERLDLMAHEFETERMEVV